MSLHPHHHPLRRGWRNDYRHGMPLSEALSKDLKYFFKDAWHWMLNGGKLPVIRVFPQFPSSRTTLYKIADALRYRLTNHHTKTPSVLVYFNDHTYSKSPEIPDQYAQILVINRNCNDISKTRVDEVHQQIFGYNTRVDAHTHQGNAVLKSNSNAMHDGHIVHCPMKDQPEDTICQIVIDNAADAEYVVDYRVPVIGKDIPLVYLKFKHFHQRFTNHVARTEMTKPTEVFTEMELEKIRSFAHAMSADFCEFDVLRHKGDGRIYIIDVNKTPYGPPKGLVQADKAVALLADSFRRNFLVGE
ncbi:MAG: hypothetical protein JNM00_07770 [Flavobacteriales bacterium]|nr:hypothetical protein [Flavobacteriales bacterium]